MKPRTDEEIAAAVDAQLSGERVHFARLREIDRLSFIDGLVFGLLLSWLIALVVAVVV